MLTSLLPAELLPHLPSREQGRESLLEALSSGQLLCSAYNAGIRRSRKPWGYINKDGVHDIVALEARQESPVRRPGTPDISSDGDKKRVGWTFRRTDNIRLWAAALKLRYLIPLIGVPTDTSTFGKTPSSPTSSHRFPAHVGPPIVFDARIIARKDQGWTDMLEETLFAWMDAVVEEMRGKRR